MAKESLWEELQWRGMVHQATDDDLGRLLAGEQFTGYTGFDATADSLHAGHLIPILGLRRLQRAGHKPIALVGGGTTMIGDPSFRDTDRPVLPVDEIDANVTAIREQLARFLDFDGPAAASMLNNGEWLRDLRLTDFLRDVGSHFSVNVMTAKESVKARLAHGLTYTEFSYMLLQAYDFLHLYEAYGCRLQLGGSDQWGNITAGAELIRRRGAGQAYGMTWPLLTRADGSKFGKSDGDENVWLDATRTSPYRFYQYWLNTPDADHDRYLRLFTDLGRDEVDAIVTDPRAAQRRLAYEVAAWVHGPSEAARARDASEVLFGGGDPRALDEGLLLDVFAEVPSSTEPAGEAELVDLLAHSGLVKSKSEARKAIEAGGVYVNGVREANTERRVGGGDLLHGRYLVLRRGKKQYHLVRFGEGRRPPGVAV